MNLKKNDIIIFLYFPIDERFWGDKIRKRRNLKMKLKKLTFAGFLAAATLTLAACGGNDNPATTTETGKGTTVVPTEPTETSKTPEVKKFYTAETSDDDVYMEVFGEFYAAYAEAKEEENVAKSYALQAIAEAKLLESGVMLPTTTQGGNYALTKVAPRTVSSVLWGTDSDRFGTMIVANEKIKGADRAAMLANWNEHKAEEDYDHDAYVKKYLADHGYTLKTTYNTLYTSDVTEWDALATSQAVDSEVLVNTYAGLLEYDNTNKQKPACATGYTVSKDGLKYTFTLRHDVKWVDAQGAEVATLKADDFVAGFQHMLDAAGGLEYLVDGVIANASEYLGGEAEFDEVGVKALDDYTVEYTLVKPTSYFNTMLAYNIFAPLNRAYYQSKGGKFGADFDAAAEDYTYGKGYDSILYNGAYRLTEVTKEAKETFTKNTAYFDAAKINIEEVNWRYTDGKDVKKAYTDFQAGTVDGCGLNTTTLKLAKDDGLFDEYNYVTDTNATTFMNFVNIKRQSYENYNDGAVKSTKTAAEKEATFKALQNQNFRLALLASFDRQKWNAVSVGDDLALNSLRNSYTPGNFVTLPEAVTVSINGENKTFAAGTLYGEIMQAQLTADGSHIKAFDTEKLTGDGYDGWYNVEAAKAYMAKAVKELGEMGLDLTKTKIKIELPVFTQSEIRAGAFQVFKKSVEGALGDYIEFVQTECTSQEQWLYTAYRCKTGAQGNYDNSDVSGWGPDYGDPSTYLDTFMPAGGYMTKSVGLY